MQEPLTPETAARSDAAAPAPYLRFAERLGALTREDEILQVSAQALRELFPDLMFCFRLLRPGSAELSSVYATGKLRPEMRDRVRATAGESEDADLLRRCGVEIAGTYEPVFVGTAGGMDAVLHDGRQVLGIANAEWEGGGAPDDARAAVLATLWGQVAAALRNVRLAAESAHLRDYLAKLIDHANVPILVVDSGRRIRVFNRFLEGLTGHPRDAVVDRDVLELLHDQDHRRFLAALTAALAAKPTSDLELRILAAGDRPATRVAFNLASFVGADGETVDGVIAFGRDVTEIRRLQAQVIHAEKLATIGQLAAGVVHEINNPLTSISVYADYLFKLMDRENRSKQEMTYVTRIREATDRILRFTQDLMAFARPAGDEPDQLELSDVIDEAAAFCEHVVARNGVRVVKEFADVPRVYAVRGQIQQVFINLITNACHAMAEVDRTRILGLRVADHGDGRVRAEVSDTGAGIPDEIRDRVFDPFVSSKPRGEGTGLGLSIVKNIVDNHQGEISFESEAGRGTTFRLLFYAV